VVASAPGRIGRWVGHYRDRLRRVLGIEDDADPLICIGWFTGHRGHDHDFVGARCEDSLEASGDPRAYATKRRFLAPALEAAIDVTVLVL
jgi:hypothetical protein